MLELLEVITRNKGNRGSAWRVQAGRETTASDSTQSGANLQLLSSNP